MRREARLGLIAAAGLLATIVPAAEIAGQAVAGQVREAGTARPLNGAFVVLLDERGTRQNVYLADSTGRFAVRARAAGTYRLRVELIGYDSYESGPLAVGDGTLSHDVYLPPRAVPLPRLRASTRPVCGRGAGGVELQALWEEVRKVLTVTDWTARQSNAAQYTLLQYARDYRPDLRGILTEERAIVRSAAVMPYAAAARFDFFDNGFYVEHGDERLLLGPDAAVLLSDAFLEHYCLSIRPDPAGELVGLGFEPHRDRRTTDIRGVLWVDRQSAELRRLEYDYVRLPVDLEHYGARGQAWFRRLSNGQWIVDRWWIRTPRIEVRPGTLRNPQGRLAAIREDGGVVLAVTDPGGADLVRHEGTGSIEGEIHDAARGIPLRDALVFVIETGQETSTDTRGRFRIDGVPHGAHTVSYRHPLLALADAPSPVDTVGVVAGQVTRQRFDTPAIQALFATACPGETADHSPRSTGLLLGTVYSPDGAPVAGAKVRAAWHWNGQRAGRWRTATTGSDGRYALCWLPEAVVLELSVHMPGVARSLPEAVLANRDRVLVRDIR
jgi:hypothetical protein